MVPGVLGNSLSCVHLGLKALISAEPWLHDPEVVKLPWDEESYVSVDAKAKMSGLYLGLMETDGVVAPHPPIARAMRMVREALVANKHKVFVVLEPAVILDTDTIQVIEWNPPDHRVGDEIHVRHVSDATDGQFC